MGDCMAIVLSIANQKGGIGKTTSTYNLAAALAEKGKRVLMIDVDIQCSLTYSCTISEYLSIYEGYSTSDLFDKKIDPSDCCFPVVSMYPKINWENTENVTEEQWNKVKLYIIPSSAEMAKTQREINTITGLDKFETFKRNINRLRDYFDFILLDCLPTLDGLLTASLIVSDGVIIPAKPERLSCEGVDYLVETIESVKNANDDIIRNSNLEIIGVIVTMFRKQLKEHNELYGRLEKDFNVLGTIPLSASVTSGVAEGLPVVKKRPTAAAAQEYVRIATLLLQGVS